MTDGAPAAFYKFHTPPRRVANSACAKNSRLVGAIHAVENPPPVPLKIPKCLYMT